MATKVLRDTIKNADRALREMEELTLALKTCADWSAPYTGTVRMKYKSAPAYFVASRKELMGAPISNFHVNYPTLAKMAEDSEASDTSMKRLNSAIYNISLLNEKLKETSYMPKTDVDRAECVRLAKQAMADLVVFTLIQFRVGDTEDGTLMSVQQFCNDRNITPDIYYGTLLTTLDETGCSIYGYEAPSPYYDNLMAIDASLMAECEECDFPLTDELAEQLVNGSLELVEFRGMVVEHAKKQKDNELKDLTPGNMLQRLSLA